MTRVDADIGALRGLHEALSRFRDAQQEVAGRAGDAIGLARASLEARAARWQARLEQARAELAACRDLAAQAAYREGPAGYGDGPAGYGDGSGDYGPAGQGAGPAALAGGALADCSALEQAVAEAAERLERIRRWQQRVEQEASEFAGAAARFGGLLDDDLPRTGDYLLAMADSLEAARASAQAPGS